MSTLFLWPNYPPIKRVAVIPSLGDKAAEASG